MEEIGVEGYLKLGRVGALLTTRAKPLSSFRSQSWAKLRGPGPPRAQAQSPAAGEQAGLQPTWRGKGEEGGAGNEAGAGAGWGRSRSREAAPRLTRASGARL